MGYYVVKSNTTFFSPGQRVLINRERAEVLSVFPDGFHTLRLEAADIITGAHGSQLKLADEPGEEPVMSRIARDYARSAPPRQVGDDDVDDDERGDLARSESRERGERRSDRDHSDAHRVAGERDSDSDRGFVPRESTSSGARRPKP